MTMMGLVVIPKGMPVGLYINYTTLDLHRIPCHSAAQQAWHALSELIAYRSSLIRIEEDAYGPR